MVILKALGKAWDITRFVDRPYEFNDVLTGLWDSGKITITGIKADELEGIDLSRRIPINSIVEIERHNGVRSYMVETPTVVKEGHLYKHVLTLTEPRITENRPIPDFAITQPTDDFDYFVSEGSRVTDPTVHDNVAYLEDITDLGFAITQVSNDTGYIDNRQVKADGTYKINFSITFGRIQAVFPASTATVKAYLKINGVTKRTHDFGTFGNLLWATVGTISFEENIELNNGDKIGVAIGLSGSTEQNYIWLNVKSGFLNIEIKKDLEAPEPIYMDDVVEKIISLVNVTGVDEFILDPTSKARLGTILAYDEMHTEATMKTALDRVASFVKARVYIELKDRQKIIKFAFYDDLAKQDYIEPNDESEVIQAPSNEYFSGLALQNNNITGENFVKETLTIMGGSLDTRQIKTDDIAVFTTYPIDRIKKFRVYNFGISPYDVTSREITDFVLEKTHYDTLDNMADYDNRLLNNKNNHLYYIRGDNKIYGMGFVGSQFEKWESSKSNRALYETVATLLHRELPHMEIPKWVDGGMNRDAQVEIEIWYYPISETNAIIYKDDQTGFEQKLISRFNANDRINHTDYLGEYAKQTINSIGGTQKSKRGVSHFEAPITELGTVSPQNERVVNITYFEYEDSVEYYVTLVKDYIFRSHYIGIDKDRRLLHIPKDQYVKRVDRSLNVINLIEEKAYYNNSVIDPKLFLNSLVRTGVMPRRPEVVELKFDDKSKKILLPNIIALGTTIEWYVEALDNYALMYERFPLAGVTNGYYQKSFAYSNVFGNINQVVVKVKEREDSEKNHAYFSYEINKDAREQFALSIQTAILSKSEKIIVYSGLAKHNQMVKFDIWFGDKILAVLDYKPNIDDKYVDLGRIKEQFNNTTIETGEIKVTLEHDGMGYVWYDRRTGELMLAYIGEVEAGEHKIYYNAESYDFRTGLHAPKGLWYTKPPTIVEIEYDQPVSDQEYDIYVTIRNNEDRTVDVEINVLGMYEGGQVLDTIEGNETKTIRVGWDLGLKPRYLAKVTAKHEYKETSKEVVAKLVATEKE